ALIADIDSLSAEEEAEIASEGQVILMTLHSAKGLEFPVVFLVGMEEGVFPHSRALFDESEMEEERRLAYVGITRAEERLFLTGARVRTLFGRTNSNAPSRFFQEISSDLLDGMTQQAEGYSRYGFGARTAEPRIFSGAGNKGVPGSTGTAFGGASGAAASTGAGSTGSSLGRGTVHQPAKMASHGGGAG
ncbi:ATP-binding domain-containing protein, partial [Microbacteriaceae bacterium K1510]|nr:ATP-binding domain-containing protein [Microbacteriaceae bacterium K1510]